MRRLALLAPVLALAAGLLLPAASSAIVFESGGAAPAATAACPTQCQAIGRVTGYTGGYDGRRYEPFYYRRSGRLLAFTVTLGKPDEDQIEYFTRLYGGAPQVRLTVVRRGRTRATRSSNTVVAQSSTFAVERYLGSSPTFVLDTPLRVRRGYRVALTVPTWAPVFAVGLSTRNWWRASRRPGTCRNVRQRAAQLMLGDQRRYGCTYRGARLLYSVTFVPDNVRTDRATTSR